MKAYKYTKNKQIFVLYDLANVPNDVNYEVIEIQDNTNELQNEQEIEQLKQMQYNELLPTDWYFVRKAELGIDVPQFILDERQAIRDKYSNLINNK